MRASRTRAAVLAVLAVLATAAGGAGPAAAFCFENLTDTPVHLEALAPNGFVADVAPGGRACCDGAACSESPVPVLVVTGFVPVAEGRPGWTAECRIEVRTGDLVRMRGDENRISCARDGD